MTKDLAQTAVVAFATRSGLGAFTQIKRDEVALTLLHRIHNPHGINQGSFAGLCGPAALSYEIASRNPLGYANTVIALYEVGIAKLGKWELKPSVALQRAPCPATNPAADWILLASIRDSENWFFDYVTDKYDDDKNHPYLNNLSFAKGAGTSTSEMVKMMTKVGFQKVNSNEASTNLFDKKFILNESIAYYNKDYQVIWIINADIIKGLPVDGSFAHANHFVALAGAFSPPTSDTALVSVPIFTWGKIMNIPDKGAMPFKDFMSGFFGYVAGQL